MIRLSRIACALPERSSAYGPWDAGRCAVPGSGAPSSSRTGSAGCEPVLAIENHQPFPYVLLPYERRSKTSEYRNRPNPPTRRSKRATVHGGHASVSVACRFQSGGCPESLSRRSGGGRQDGTQDGSLFFPRSYLLHRPAVPGSMRSLPSFSCGGLHLSRRLVPLRQPDGAERRAGALFAGRCRSGLPAARELRPRGACVVHTEKRGCPTIDRTASFSFRRHRSTSRSASL